RGLDKGDASRLQCRGKRRAQGLGCTLVEPRPNREKRSGRDQRDGNIAAMAIVLVDGVQCRHHSSETAAEDQQSRHFSISLRGSALLHAVLEPLSASGDGASRLLSSKLICDVCQRSLCERLPHAPFPFQHHRMNCADATLRRLCFGWLDQNTPVANLAT